jgi:hypothetical protein
MSEKSVRSATRPQSNQQQVAADCINQALEKSDIAEICHAIAAATRPPRTLRPAVGRFRLMACRLPAVLPAPACRPRSMP